MNDKKLHVNLISESDFTIHGHGVHTAFVEMREQLTRRDDIQLSINSAPAKQFNITHIHTVGLFSLRRLLSPRGGKKIVSAHIVPSSLIGSLAAADFWSPMAARYLRWFYNRADAVIAVSPYTRDELLKMGVRSPIRVLENSIDITKYKTSAKEKRSLRQQFGFGDQDFVVVGNGQIQPRKKFDTFVAVAKSLPDVQFVWVGGIPFKVAGADFAHLNKLMKKPPKNVRITDVVSLKTAGLYMRAADLMFMPSSQETFGLAIIEGAASGLPVLVRDIADYDATFGDLVLRGNNATFRKLILKIREEPAFAKIWRQKSHQLAQKYDASAATDKLIEFYKEIAS